MEDCDKEDVASCIRSGISWARIKSSSSVSNRARISDGSNTWKRKDEVEKVIKYERNAHPGISYRVFAPRRNPCRRLLLGPSHTRDRPQTHHGFQPRRCKQYLRGVKNKAKRLYLLGIDSCQFRTTSLRFSPLLFELSPYFSSFFALFFI